MPYQPFLISQFSTALDKSVQPWLIPDEAQESLLDGFVYRGEWCSRPGYQPFATGQIGSTPYCESRMVRHVTHSMTGAIDSANKTYTITATAPLRRGSFTVTGNTPAQSLTDNGLGYFLFPTVTVTGVTNANPANVTAVAHGYTTGDQVVISGVVGMTQVNSPIAYTITVTGPDHFTLDGTNSTLWGVFSGNGKVAKVAGTINYTTGAVSVTYATAPTGGTVLAGYDYHPGYPVMMSAIFITALNVKQLILCDTHYVNRYDPATNRLEDISPASAFTGDNSNFFSWVNYQDADGNPRLLFTNNINPIQQYDGTTVSDYVLYTVSTAVASESYGAGSGIAGPYTHTASNIPIVRGSITITAGAQTVSDDGFGVLVGSGTGTVNYATGAISVTFTAVVLAAVPITLDYKYSSVPITTALHLFDVKDRLVVLRPTYSGSKYEGKRILISGTGVYCDTFTNDAPGAGLIDIPDPSWIMSAAFNRDDLIIFTDGSSWIMKYTGSDVVPFSLDKLDPSRGSGAPYSAITYLNRTTTLSQRGFIISDGYRVDRADNKIPQFSFNEINQNKFNLCFVGSVDADRDHYLIYPSPSATKSDRILVTNYEEDNYCIYRLPVSCMGIFFVNTGVTWNDLLIYNSWAEMAAVYSDWNSFQFSKGAQLSIGGGHHGEVWSLNINGVEDDKVQIRGATVIDAHTLEITTDWQDWVLGDYVYINGMSGMTEGNNKSGAIKSITADNRVIRLDMPTTRFSTYTYGGVCSRVIPFESTTKKFNPFIDQAQKIRVGYMYVYVNATNVGTTRNVNVDGITLSNPVVINAANNQFATGDIVSINGVSGTVQINGLSSKITVIDTESFSMDSIDATAFTAYTSGGVASVAEQAFLDIDVITNDNNDYTQVEDSSLIAYRAPYRINCSPTVMNGGSKKWMKIYINQVGKFVQFRMSNVQPLADIKIQAVMFGADAIGRLI